LYNIRFTVSVRAQLRFSAVCSTLLALLDHQTIRATKVTR